MLRHRSTEADPAERGRAFGRAHAGAVANTVRVYERLLGEVAGLDRRGLLDAGERVAAGLERRWPELARELEGIAAGAGRPAPLLAAVNARTELKPSGVGECSLVAAAGPDGATVAQNWDWHPDLAASLVVWSVVQPGGRWFATLTEAGMLAKLGLTSTGLACGLNFLRSSRDGGVGGVPIHVALRVVLDRCDSRAEALTFLRSIDVTASSCITVGAGDGLAAAELSPAGCVVVEPDAAGYLAHTNHFLASLPDGRDLECADGPGSALRHAHLVRALTEDGFDPERLLRAHDSGPEPVCRHDDPAAPWADRVATLASVVLAPRAGGLRIAAGAPCAARFEALELP